MSRNKCVKIKRSAGDIVYRAVGILLMLTMLTSWLVSGLYAKYVISYTIGDSAKVAETGIMKLELWEHKANETKTETGGPGGKYELDLKDEVKGNAYEKVLPGVDIPKDPFIRLELKDTVVGYELYVRAIESDPFPEYVTYELTSDWECVDPDNGIYKYKDVFEANKPYNYTDGSEIQILKDEMIYVSEHYVGSGQKFTLTFEAWLSQVIDN